jgi:hypothetical protein
MGSRPVPSWCRIVAIVTIVVAAMLVRRFFFGKRLTADDLSEDQEYRRCRRRLR